MEIWLIIQKYPKYEISSTGRIRNYTTKRILRQSVDENGYFQVGLWDSSGQHTKKIHRLVAENFYDVSQNDLEVNHLDGDKSNNFVGNLEWCTRSENMLHAHKNGLARISPNAGVPRKKVKILETGKIYESIRECARNINVSESRVSECINGKAKTCRGYHFKEIKEGQPWYD